MRTVRKIFVVTLISVLLTGMLPVSGVSAEQNSIQLSGKQSDEFVSFMYKIALYVGEGDSIEYSDTAPGNLFPYLLAYQTVYNYDLYPGDASGLISSSPIDDSTELYKVSSKVVETILSGVFNCSQDYINKARSGGIKNDVFDVLYYEDGYYCYSFSSFGGGDLEFSSVDISEAAKIDEFYYIVFNTSIEYDVDDYDPVYTGPMYCKLKYKNFEGKDYWSICKLSQTKFADFKSQSDINETSARKPDKPDSSQSDNAASTAATSKAPVKAETTTASENLPDNTKGTDAAQSDNAELTENNNSASITETDNTEKDETTIVIDLTDDTEQETDDPETEEPVDKEIENETEKKAQKIITAICIITALLIIAAAIALIFKKRLNMQK